MPALLEQITRKDFADGGFVDFAWGATAVLGEDKLKPFAMYYDTFLIEYADLQRIAQAITQGKIWVYYDGTRGLVTGPDGQAQYFPAIDLLATNFNGIGDFWYNGILVHEALHAVCDERLEFNSVDKNTLECIAFAGQCLYYRLKGWKGSGRTDFAAIPNITSKGLDVFTAAFALADYWIANPRGQSSKLEAALSKAVSALPGYEKFSKILASDYDGLNRKPGPTFDGTLTWVKNVAELIFRLK